MDRLVLFDVDRTLLSGNSVHERAFRHALRRVFGVDARLESVNHHGKTDSALIVEVLVVAGLAEEAIRPRLAEVREHMIAHFKEHVGESDASVLPGVREVLRALAERRVLCGLVTGNLEEIAWAKLGHCDLARCFRLGGFGDEQEDRAELISSALRQAEALCPGGFPGGITHVGDTPHDLDAAHRAGIRGIGVATGIYSLEELATHPHHALLPDLADTEAFLRAVGL